VKRQVPRSRALLASAGLSILFLFVYGFCNWITAQRSHVGSFYFEWERRLPFVPLLIPAYLSLDLFFIGAPFLCETREELRIYSRRIFAAIIIAGICFLLFPFRFAFPRPEVHGPFGTVFDWFRAIDAPYNLVPSLHAALLLLVGNVYLRHLRGNIRIVTLGWLVLIGLSPILTYQHHLIDILSGFVLAAYCFYFLPDNRVTSPITMDRRLGWVYAAGAIALLVIAPIFGNWAGLMIWPPIALVVVAAAYFGNGPSVFRKMNGQIPWSSRFVLAPYLLGQELSLMYYQRKCRPWDAVTPRVWIGRKLTNRLAKQAMSSGVRAVLDLTAEFSEPAAFRNTVYCNIPVLDLTAPTQVQLFQMGRFIAEQEQHGIVYVHCKIGYSRSAAAGAAYLLMSGTADTADDAFSQMRRVRPSIVIRPEIVSALERFESVIRQSAPAARSFVLASPERSLA